MICPKCGKENLDTSNFCGTCGENLRNTEYHRSEPVSYDESTRIQEIKDYLVFAILVTIFCCMPLGILAIIYSSKVSKYQYLEDFDSAMNASKKAKIWCIVSLVLGIAFFLLFFIGVFMLALLSSASNSYVSSYYSYY